jgi:hypothetical protein
LDLNFVQKASVKKKRTKNIRLYSNNILLVRLVTRDSLKFNPERLE